MKKLSIITIIILIPIIITFFLTKKPIYEKEGKKIYPLSSISFFSLLKKDKVVLCIQNNEDSSYQFIDDSKLLYENKNEVMVVNSKSPYFTTPTLDVMLFINGSLIKAVPVNDPNKLYLGSLEDKFKKRDWGDKVRKYEFLQ